MNYLNRKPLFFAACLLLTILCGSALSNTSHKGYRAGFDPIPLTTEGDMTPLVSEPWAMSGHAEALLLSCMDYRLIEHVGQFVQHDLGLTDEYDYVVLAGASLGVNNTKYPEWGATFWNHVGLAIQLHSIKEVIIIDHRNCGAYRLLLGKDFPVEENDAQKAEEALAHKEQLDNLAKAVHTKYPDLGVKTYLMSLDGHVDAVGEIKAPVHTETKEVKH